MSDIEVVKGHKGSTYFRRKRTESDIPRILELDDQNLEPWQIAERLWTGEERVRYVIRTKKRERRRR